MPNTSLRSALNDLAQTFADSVLAAIRSATIQDLHAEGGGWSSSGRSGRGARAAGGGGGGQPDPLRGARKTKNGRLARRSPEDIAKTLAQVVALVKKTRAGMRSEQIRKALKLDVREVPRVLKEGVKTKLLKSKGQKRATVYRAG